MFLRFGEFFIWFYRDVIIENMLFKFKKEFLIIFGIFDCIEIKISKFLLFKV